MYMYVSMLYRVRHNNLFENEMGNSVKNEPNFNFFFFLFTFTKISNLVVEAMVIMKNSELSDHITKKKKKTVIYRK